MYTSFDETLLCILIMRSPLCILFHIRHEEEMMKAEMAKRTETIQMKARRLKQECAKSLEAERKTRRYRDSIAQSIMFSYFSYIPPSRQKSQKSDNKGTRGKRSQTVRSK